MYVYIHIYIYIYIYGPRASWSEAVEGSPGEKKTCGTTFSRISHTVVSIHLAEAGKLQATSLKPLPGQPHCYRQPHCQCQLAIGPCGAISFQSTKSGTGLQFLPPACGVEARTKGMLSLLLLVVVVVLSSSLLSLLLSLLSLSLSLSIYTYIYIYETVGGPCRRHRTCMYLVADPGRGPPPPRPSRRATHRRGSGEIHLLIVYTKSHSLKLCLSNDQKLDFATPREQGDRVGAAGLQGALGPRANISCRGVP